MKGARTSRSHPLEIDELATPGGGRIGITFAPGKHQPHASSGAWARDLAADLDAVKSWGAQTVVTLIRPQELHDLKIPALGAEVARRGMAWRHLAIDDFGVPDQTFEAAWPDESLRLLTLLRAGGRVLVHCKGGLGRAGMVAARLLVELGATPADAIRAVRATRGADAIETPGQERWVARGAG